jgi:hypothetical protein
MNTYAADWGRRDGLWTTSEKEYGSCRWYYSDNFYKEACHDVLAAFGLSEKDFEDFSLEKIARMGPKELAKIGTKNPHSFTLGDDRFASEVD